MIKAVGSRPTHKFASGKGLALGHHRRYRLSVVHDPHKPPPPGHITPNPEYREFDAVILAAPLPSSKVDLDDLGLRSIASLTPLC